MNLGSQTVSIAKADSIFVLVDYIAKRYHTYWHTPFHKLYLISLKSFLYAIALVVGLLIILSRNATTLRDSLLSNISITKDIQGTVKN